MWPAHVEEMQRRGLTVTAQDEEFTAKVRAVHLGDACGLRERFDAVFLSVKSYDSVWAAQFLQPFLKPAGILVLAQNSINEEWVAPIVGYTRVVAAWSPWARASTSLATSPAPPRPRGLLSPWAS